MLTGTIQQKREAPQHYFMVYPGLAEFLDSGDMAALVHRLHYWLQNKDSGHILRDGCRWIYNGYKEWRKQMTWKTERQIGRMIRTLEKLGWIISSTFAHLKHEVGFASTPPAAFQEDNQRKWYRLNYQKIYEDTGIDLLFKEGLESAPGANDQNRYNASSNSGTLQSTKTGQSSIYKEDSLKHQTEQESGVFEEEEKAKMAGDDSTDDLDLDPPHAEDLKESDREELNDPNEDDFAPAPAPQFQNLNNLKANGVRLEDPALVGAMREFPERLATAEQAFLEYAQTTALTHPVRALVKAIRENWQPQALSSLKGGFPEEVNPPNADEMKDLEDLKAAGRIRDFYLSGDGVTKVVLRDGFTRLPWWEVLPIEF